MLSAVKELECELFFCFHKTDSWSNQSKRIKYYCNDKNSHSRLIDLLKWFRWHFFPSSPFFRLFFSVLLNQMLMTISSAIPISRIIYFGADITVGEMASVGIRLFGSSVIESRGDNFLKSSFTMTNSCRKTWGWRRNLNETLLTRIKRWNDSSWQTCYRLFADSHPTRLFNPEISVATPVII